MYKEKFVSAETNRNVLMRIEDQLEAYAGKVAALEPEDADLLLTQLCVLNRMADSHEVP